MYKCTLFYPWIFLIVAVKAHLADENETGLGISELDECNGNGKWQTTIRDQHFIDYFGGISPKQSKQTVRYYRQQGWILNWGRYELSLIYWYYAEVFQYHQYHKVYIISVFAFKRFSFDLIVILLHTLVKLVRSHHSLFVRCPYFFRF